MNNFCVYYPEKPLLKTLQFSCLLEYPLLPYFVFNVGSCSCSFSLPLLPQPGVLLSPSSKSTLSLVWCLTALVGTLDAQHIFTQRICSCTESLFPGEISAVDGPNTGFSPSPLDIFSRISRFRSLTIEDGLPCNCYAKF